MESIHTINKNSYCNTPLHPPKNTSWSQKERKTETKVLANTEGQQCSILQKQEDTKNFNKFIHFEWNLSTAPITYLQLYSHKQKKRALLNYLKPEVDFSVLHRSHL
jgi:hypothetical protein